MTGLWIFTAGVLVGFPIGVMFDDALDLYRASRKEPPVTTKPTWRTLLTWLLALVVLIQLGVGVLLIQTRLTATDTASNLADYQECVSMWQQDFAAAYKARYTASLPVADALDEIVLAVSAGDRDRINVAIEEFLEVRDDQTVERRDNPLPPLPDQLCGTAPKGDE